MTQLDMKTIMLTSAMTNVICTLVMLGLWLNNRKRLRGVLLWFMDYLLQSTAMFLVVLRGTIHDFFSIVLSNFLIILGAIFGYMGLARFVGKPATQAHNFLLLTVFSGLHVYLTFIDNSLFYRNVNFTVALLIICAQCSVYLLIRVDKASRGIGRGVGLVFAAYAVISLLRICWYATGHHAQDLFRSDVVDKLFIASYQALFIVLTYSFMLMVNKRLAYEIGLEQEKFYTAFHSSPYAVILTNMQDGRITEVNDGFYSLTGYSPEEVIGQTTIDLRLWVDAERRGMILELLNQHSSIRNHEIEYMNKRGEIHTGLLSADIITINSRPAILASINDISERKAAEEKIRKLLAEKEIILRETHHRIKNNMNMVNSMLYIQAEMAEETRVRSALLDAANRVIGMMLLYDRLYNSKNTGMVSVRDYLGALVREIVSVYPAHSPVQVECDIDDFEAGENLLSALGIILNELITNSLKYAFHGMDNGRISVSVRRHNSRATMSYRDNGPGIPDTVNLDKPSGFGMRLVSLLVEQIGGTVDLQRENGVAYSISFDL